MVTKPSGQSVIEVLSVCLSLILLLKGILLVFWFTAGSLWVDHQLYQKLICRAEGRSQTLCRKKLIKNIKAIHPAGSVIHFQMDRGRGFWSGKIKWTLYGIHKDSRQRLTLP